MPPHHAHRRQDLQPADDQRDPAPGAQAAEHVVGVGGEHVRVGDRGDAVDQVEAADHGQQGDREYHQAVALAFRAASPCAPGWRGCCRRHCDLPYRRNRWNRDSGLHFLHHRSHLGRGPRSIAPTGLKKRGVGPHRPGRRDLVGQATSDPCRAMLPPAGRGTMGVVGTTRGRLVSSKRPGRSGFGHTEARSLPVPGGITPRTEVMPDGHAEDRASEHRRTQSQW